MTVLASFEFSVSEFIAEVQSEEFFRWLMKTNIMAVIASLICLLGVSGCSIYPDRHSVFASLGLVDHFTVSRHRNFVFPIDASFYIPIPTVKAQSHSIDVFVLESSVDIAYSALSSRFPYAITGSHPEGLDAAFTSAEEKRCNYVFYMEFIETFDSVGWPGRPDWPVPGGVDRVHLKVILAEVRTRQIIDSIDIQSESGWSTFLGDRPVDLLLLPLRNVSMLLSSQWN